MICKSSVSSTGTTNNFSFILLETQEVWTIYVFSLWHTFQWKRMITLQLEVDLRVVQTLSKPSLNSCLGWRKKSSNRAPQHDHRMTSSITGCNFSLFSAILIKQVGEWDWLNHISLFFFTGVFLVWHFYDAESNVVNVQLHRWWGKAENTERM